MDYLKMLHKHLTLECKQLDERNDLVGFPCAAPDDIPRLYVAQHRDQYHVYFRHDVPLDTRRQLLAMAPETLFAEQERVKAILDAAAVTNEGVTWHGKSYVFLGEPALELRSDIQYADQSDQCTIVVEGQTIAQCMSVRANLESAEAYVEVHPDFRRRGLGKDVVYAWSQRVQQSGRIPFYSHHVNNIASQRLAEALGFTWYIDDVGYE